MRRLAIALIALSPLPALAQSAPPPTYEADDDAPFADADHGPPGRTDGRMERDLGRAGAALSDPRTARQMADAMTAMSDALLDLRVDRLREAIDPADRDGARTLGELVERDDPYFRERMHEDAERAVRGAGRAARGAALMAPELRAMADEFRRRLELAIARASRP